MVEKHINPMEMHKRNTQIINDNIDDINESIYRGEPFTKIEQRLGLGKFVLRNYLIKCGRYDEYLAIRKMIKGGVEGVGCETVRDREAGDAERVLTLYRNGMTSMAEIARTVGITKDTVRGILLASGDRTRTYTRNNKNKRYDADKKAIMKDLLSGMPLSDVAKKHNVTTGALEYWDKMKEFGGKRILDCGHGCYGVNIKLRELKTDYIKLGLTTTEIALKHKWNEKLIIETLKKDGTYEKVESARSIINEVTYDYVKGAMSVEEIAAKKGKSKEEIVYALKFNGIYLGSMKDKGNVNAPLDRFGKLIVGMYVNKVHIMTIANKLLVGTGDIVGKLKELGVYTGYVYENKSNSLQNILNERG